MAGQRDLSDKIIEVQKRNRRRRRRVTALGVLVAAAVAVALIVPALSISADKATPEAGFFLQSADLAAGSLDGNGEDESGSAAASDASAPAAASSEAETQAASGASGSQQSSSGQSFSEDLTDEAGAVLVTVSVEAPEGALPEGATMRIKQVTDADVIDAAKDEAAATSDIDSDEAQVMAVDIAFIDADGNEVEPSQDVRVTMSYPDVSGISSADSMAVVHVDDDLNAETLADDAVTLSNDEEQVAFDAAQFSVYAIVYTVDFRYDDEVSGKAYEHSIFGGTTVSLRKLLPLLGVTDADGVDGYLADISSVTFSDPDLIKVAHETPEENAQGVNDWKLESLVPFKTDERLVISLANGDNVIIWVTDDQTTLSDLVTDASLVIDGKTYGKNQTWEVYPDVSYVLNLSFGENGVRQFPEGGNTIAMPAPAGLKFHEGDGGTFDIPAGLAGTITGNSWVVRDGMIYLTFGEDPDDILTRSSTVRFGINVNVTFSPDAKTIHFNDRVEPKVDIDKDGKVDVSKTSTYNQATGQIDYVVTVRSSGNTEDIVVTDALSGDAQKIVGEISVQPSSLEVKNKTQSGDTGFSLTIGSLGHNETATIRYSTDVDLSQLENFKFTGDDGKNTVTANPKEGEGDTESYSYNNEIKYSNVGKSNVSSETKGDSTVMTWKVVVNNPAIGSIAGATITDQIEWGSKDVMTYQKDASNKVALTITVKDAAGNVVDTRNEAAELKQTGEGMPESWSYTIPESDKDKKYTYEIKYQTVVNTDAAKASGNGMVRNNVNNDYGGNSTGTGIVPGVNPGGTPGDGDQPGGPVAAKSAKKVTPDYIDWDIVIVVPPEGFPGGLTVVDDLPWSYPDDKDGFYGLVDSFGSVVGVTGLVGSEGWDTPTITTSNDKYLSDGNDGSAERQIVTIAFHNSKGDPGLDATNASRTVTLTIRTENNQDWMKAGTFNEHFVTHQNNANVNGTYVSATAKPTLPTVTKTGEQTNRPDFAQGDGADDTIYFAYDVRLTNVTADTLPIVVEDAFDADFLEFVEPAEYRLQDGQPTTQATDKQSIYIRYGETSYDGMTNAKVPTYSYDPASPGKLTITVAAEDVATKEDGSYYPFYHVRYYLRVKPDKLDALRDAAIANKGTYSLGNTAVWEGEQGHTDVKYTVPAVTKDGWFHDSVQSGSNNRLYDFLVDINPQKLTLNAGAPLTIVDSHTANLSVDYTSVKAYKVSDGDAAFTQADFRKALEYKLRQDKGETLEPWQQELANAFGTTLQEVGKDELSWNFNGSEGTFEGMQDATHYMIYYSALIVGTGSQTFSNEVDMEGFYAGKQDSRYYDNNTSGSAEVYQIQLLKHEAGKTSHGLQGATFQLFMDDGDGEKIPMTYGDTRITRGEGSDNYLDTHGANVVGQPITFTTDQNGYLLVALNQDSHGAQLEEGVHYYLKEVASPTGYKIDSSVEYWSFTLTQDPDEVNYGGRDAYGVRQWIYFYYDDILKMANYPVEDEEKLNITVDKTWLDVSGNEMADTDGLTATVQLKRQVNGGEFENYEDPVTLNAEHDWSYTWADLPREEDDNFYDYELEEVGVPTGFVSTQEMWESTEDDKTTRTYTLTNQKVEERSTTLKVMKEWTDANGEVVMSGMEGWDDLPESIEFTLYRVVSNAPFASQPTAGGNRYSVDVTGNQYLANDQGTYTLKRDGYAAGVDFGELPLVKMDANGKPTFYAYYIKEEPVQVVSDGQVTKSYRVSTKTVEGENDIVITMQNAEVPEEQTTNLVVTKKWLYDSGTQVTPINPPSEPVTVSLYQVSSKDPFTGNPSSGGKLYDAKTQWGGYDGNWNRVSDGTYQIGVNGNWGGLWFSSLPSVAVNDKGEATYYAYYVKETAVEGYDTTYVFDTDANGNATIEVQNIKQPKTTDLAVKKSWTTQGNPVTWPDGIGVLVELYQDGQPMASKADDGSGEPMQVVLQSDKTSTTFKGLPEEDANGNPFTYTVRESVLKKNDQGAWEPTDTIGDKQFVGTITQEDGGYAIVNDLRGPGKLVVKKTVSGEAPAGIDPLFTVTGPNSYEVTKKYSEMGDAHEWVLDDLAFGDYTVAETQADSAEDPGISRTTVIKVDGKVKANTNDATTVTLGAADTTVEFANNYNKPMEGSGTITVNKTWASSFTDAEKPEVPVSLYYTLQDTDPNAKQAGTGDFTDIIFGLGDQTASVQARVGDWIKVVATTSGSSNFSLQINDGRFGIDETRTTWSSDGRTRTSYIYVNDDLYDASKYGTIWLASYTNSYQHGTWSVTNDSVVEDDGDSEASSVYVDSSKTTEEDVKNAGALLLDDLLLTSSNGWSGTFTNLPLYDENAQKYYVYYVVEESGEAYDATYEVDGGTVTISNDNEPETTNLTVSKIWTNEANAVITSSKAGSAEFELWQESLLTMSRTVGGTGNTIQIDFTDGVESPTGLVGRLGKPITVSYRVKVTGQNDLEQYMKQISNNRAYVHYYRDENQQGYITQLEFHPTVELAPDTDDEFILSYSIDTRLPGYSENDQPKSLKLASIQFWGSNKDIEGYEGTPNFAGAYITQGTVKTTNLYRTFTISDADNWTKEFSNLPKKSADGSITYSYYVKEINVPDGVEVSYKPASATSQSESGAVDSGTIAVTNKTTEPSKLSVLATKQWEGLGSGYHPAIKFSLYRKVIDANDAEGEEALPRTAAEARTAGYELAQEDYAGFEPTKTIQAGAVPTGLEPPETVRWDDLSETDAQGRSYKYLVVESAVEGFKLVDRTVSADGNVFSFKNAPGTTQLTVNKVWQENGADIDPSTLANGAVTYRIWQTQYADSLRSTVKEGTQPTELDFNTVTKVEADGHTDQLPLGQIGNGNSWQQVVGSLPAFTVNEDGSYTYFGYYVEEVNVPDGFTTSYALGQGAQHDNPADVRLNMGADENVVTITNGKYNVSVKLLKEDSKTSVPLAGARFRIDKLDANEKWQAYTDARFGDADAEPAEDAAAERTAEFQVDDNGLCSISGLVNGVYRFVELEAPAGYVIENDVPVIFTVTNGQVTYNTLIGRYVASDHTFIVPNAAGEELPNTGGIGTTVFYVVGVVLVVGALAFLIRRSRR